MRTLIWIVAVFLILILQQGVLTPLHLSPVNLILVLMTLALLFEGSTTALIIALAGGVMLDFLSGINLGIMTLSLLVTLGLEYFLFEMFVTREPNVILAAAAVGGATLVQAVVLLFFNWLFGLFGLDRVSLDYFWVNQLWLVFFNVLLTYPALKYFLLVEFVYGKSIRNRK